jgi:hypothetical protein
MMSPHGALFVSALSDVSLFRSCEVSFQGQNVDVAFKAERTGDLSNEIEVKYVVKDLSSAKTTPARSLGLLPLRPESLVPSFGFRSPIFKKLPRTV